VVATADQPLPNLKAAAWNFAGGPGGLALLERFVAQDLCRVLAPTGVAYILFAESGESPLHMIERASNGELGVSVVARHTDERQTLLVMRVERDFE
jgi:hypothetical protein